LSSNVFSSYSLTRLARSTQINSLKTVPSSLGLANNVQVNNKSQIVLLTENSTELNDNFALKEQYELQNETGFYIFNLQYHQKNNQLIRLFTDILDRSNDTYTNITSLPEISSYMNSHFVLISGASLAGCVILLSFGIHKLY